MNFIGYLAIYYALAKRSDNLLLLTYPFDLRSSCWRESLQKIQLWLVRTGTDFFRNLRSKASFQMVLSQINFLICSANFKAWILLFRLCTFRKNVKQKKVQSKEKKPYTPFPPPQPPSKVSFFGSRVSFYINFGSRVSIFVHLFCALSLLYLNFIGRVLNIIKPSTLHSSTV